MDELRLLREENVLLKVEIAGLRSLVEELRKIVRVAIAYLEGRW
jgi:hypothetical protein